MQLTHSQKLAAYHSTGNVLVISGPGTGKTATLVERCVMLIRKGVPIESLFVSTFTQKAANEIRERILNRLSNAKSKTNIEAALNGAYIGTFHSLCMKIIRLFPADAGLGRDIRILAEEEQRRFLFNIGIEWDEDEGDLISVISRWKDTLTSIEDAKKEAKESGSVFLIRSANAFQKYQDELKAQGYLDFSDLILNATKILKAKKEGAKWFRKRFSHFIIDEFQDVNASQVDFLKSALALGGIIWAVGDEDQSLYSWRGSDPDYCLNFKAIFPNTTTFTLEENFRSPPIIINMASGVIKRNRKRYEKNLSSTKQGTSQDIVFFKGFPSENGEASWVAEKVSEFISSGNSPKDIAILFRTNGSIPALQSALDQKMIPMSLNGIQSFWDFPEVILYADTLKHIAMGIKRDSYENLGKGKNGKRLSALVRDLCGEPLSAVAMPVAKLVLEVMPSGYDAERRETWRTSVDRILNISINFDSIKEFLTFLEQKRSQDSNSNKKECITLLSMHSAKGLEWPLVIMVGAEEGNIPHKKSSDIEEERRLFYVGMTRAKKFLFVTYAKTRNGKQRNPSRFLLESEKAYQQEDGRFIWQGKSEEQDSPKTSGQKSSKETKAQSPALVKNGKALYRHKGGKSLIPPDERAQ